MIRIASLLAFVSLVVAPACKSSEAKEAAPSGEAKAVGAAPAARSSWTQLPKFKLQVEAPAPTSVEDFSQGTIDKLGINAGTAMFSVSPIGDGEKMTREQYAKVLGADPTVKVTLTANKDLADGFDVESTTESGLVMIEIHRTIAGKEYSCGSTAPDAETANIVRAACLSLKPM